MNTSDNQINGPALIAEQWPFLFWHWNRRRRRYTSSIWKCDSWRIQERDLPRDVSSSGLTLRRPLDIFFSFGCLGVFFLTLTIKKEAVWRVKHTHSVSCWWHRYLTNKRLADGVSCSLHLSAYVHPGFIFYFQSTKNKIYNIHMII